MTTPHELQKILKQRQTRQKTSSHTKLPNKVRFWRTVRNREIIDFTRQLATMVQARLPITRSLEILAQQQKNSQFRQVIFEILEKVKSGKSLSVSLSAYPKLFGPLFVNMLTIGELSGNMSEILQQLALHLEKMGGLRRKILTAMTYPVVIIFVAIGAIGFLMFGVMPTFTDMFQDFGARMPLPARILIGVGDFVRSNIFYLLILLIGIISIIKLYTRTIKGSWIMDQLKLKYPLIGPIYNKVSIARFSRTLGTLLSSGVSLLEALEVTAQTSGNQVIQKQVLAMKSMAAKGEPMERSISRTDLFPAMVVQMIAVGEETAELPLMLTKTAEFYENEVDAAIEALTSIIEPIIIVVLGVILGGMMIAIYLQIFDLMNVIQ